MTSNMIRKQKISAIGAGQQPEDTRRCGAGGRRALETGRGREGLSGKEAFEQKRKVSVLASSLGFLIWKMGIVPTSQLLY